MCVDTVFSGHICPYFIGQSDSKVGGQTGGERRACKSNPCCNWHLCFFNIYIIFLPFASLESPQLDQERDSGKTCSKDVDLKPGCCFSALQQMAASHPWCLPYKHIAIIRGMMNTSTKLKPMWYESRIILKPSLWLSLACNCCRESRHGWFPPPPPKLLKCSSNCPTSDCNKLLMVRFRA